MSKKGRTLALAVVTVGLIGLSAPMASAATASGAPGDSGGLLNISHNQVPIQACSNHIPVNVLGIQVPVSEVSAALGLASEGLTASKQDSSCHQGTAQNNGHIHVHVSPCCEHGSTMGYGDPVGPVAERQGAQLDGPEGWLPEGDSGGLVNVSHNQVPIQFCNNHIPINVVGIQVPIDQVAAALGLLSAGPTVSVQDSSCHQGTAQNNGILKN